MITCGCWVARLDTNDHRSLLRRLSGHMVFEVNAGRTVVVGQELRIVPPVNRHIDLARSLLRGKVEFKRRGEDVFLELMRVSLLQHREKPLKEGQAPDPCSKDFLARLNAGLSERFPQWGDVISPCAIVAKPNNSAASVRGKRAFNSTLRSLAS